MNKKNHSLVVLAGIILMLFFSGCQTLNSGCQDYQDGSRPPLNFDVENLNGRLQSGLYLQKVDNLIVIMDDTASMKQCLDNWPKRDYANNMMNRIVKTIPDIQLNKAIRVYGPDVDENDYSVSLTHGLGFSPSEQLKEKILTKTMPDTQFNPIAMSLEGAYHELKLVKGKTAIIIISDFMDPVKQMISASNLIKQYYEDRVCIYPIVIGDNGPGRNSAEDLVASSGCGMTAMADVLASGPDLADFMEKVLFDKQKPAPAAIIKKPETKLSYDELLKEKKLTIELKTEFDFDKSVIRNDYLKHLQEIAEFMKTYTGTVTTIEGHTCSIGTDNYNLGLSSRRANSVKKHLTDLGIKPSRLNTASYGETRPIADNSTLDGRRKNRRAVAVITTSHKEYKNQNK